MKGFFQLLYIVIYAFFKRFFMMLSELWPANRHTAATYTSKWRLKNYRALKLSMYLSRKGKIAWSFWSNRQWNAFFFRRRENMCMFSYLDPLPKVLKEAKQGGNIKELVTSSSNAAEQHKLIQIYMAGAIIHVYFMPSVKTTITES